MELIGIEETASRLSIGRTSLWRMAKEPGFPKPIQVSKGRKAFIKSEIESWIEERIAERDEVSA